MDALTDDLARLDEDIGSLERQLSRLAAKLTGKRAERARLAESIAAQDNTGLPASRTDAIVAVLQRAAGPMSPSEVLDALTEAGRVDELRSVTATLAHLLKSNRVIRQGRGRYVAVS